MDGHYAGYPGVLVMQLDLHIHTKYSYDSFMQPSTVIRTAKRKGLDVIAITDHESMKAHATLEPSPDVIVIPGMEIKTNKGDVIGLFLNSEVQSRDFFMVTDEIRGQDGLVVLPHPYRRSIDPADLAPFVDLIEVINARSRCQDNARARELSISSNKMAVTGSDAHVWFEIGRCVMQIPKESHDLDEIRSLLLKSERICSGGCSPYYLAHGCSFIASRMKGMMV